MNTPIPAPGFDVTGKSRFKISPRPRTSYFNAIKAADLLDPGGRRFMELEIREERAGPARRAALVFRLEYPLARGRIEEHVTVDVADQVLEPVAFERSVFNLGDRRIRHEVVDFTDRAIPLPPTTYPEVLLPFLFAWAPLDGRTRSVFAWITDRFIARVRHRSTGKQTLKLPAGKVEAIAVIMFPDFNDWVRLGSVISRLVGPFVPKYRMWYRVDPPHHLLRFEGSYGPPGAPEIVLEAT